MLKLITLGENILKNPSNEIIEIDNDIKTLADEMFKTLYIANGIGLAAVQVGISKKMFVMDIEKIGKYIMINPVIKNYSNETSVFEEGCLSLPGISSEVERPKDITVEYMDLKGKIKKIDASGLLATCIQHEIDHLNGVLFIDRIAPEVRLNKLKEYKKIHIV
jgi:peptide deformylase